MQNELKERASQRMPSDEDLIDIFIAISVIAKRIARLIEKEGARQDEQNERTVNVTRRSNRVR